MKKIIATPAALAAMSITIAGQTVPMTQDHIDKAGWKHHTGTDEISGQEVHSLYTARIGDDHIGISDGQGQFGLFKKSDLRVALAGGLGTKLGMTVGYLPRRE